ncbi:hypothetical protein DTO280E4_7188 [Paecilomyces variotii]|nr:hypothetical protein DTO021C3_3197 [Paecilomyces variotii]KAJ9353595.1 hypothetical protein DTO280E4_7188 [Paecilomyces variotii]KAJ9393025.1 hypothetical protein DTO063F5_162 [Paecilomyces variotii]
MEPVGQMQVLPQGQSVTLIPTWAHKLQATLFLSAEDPNAAAHFINKLLNKIYEGTYWGQHDLKQTERAV